MSNGFVSYMSDWSKGNVSYRTQISPTNNNDNNTILNSSIEPGFSLKILRQLFCRICSEKVIRNIPIFYNIFLILVNALLVV